jgi:predicted HTH domain antitoxin
MQSSTLHIKIKPELAEGLKKLSRKRETSVGELVRKAVLSCYQLELLDLNERQRRAVEAFQGGYISLGKLAEEMGMNVLTTRKWLNDHDIPQNNSFLEDDVKNA